MKAIILALTTVLSSAAFADGFVCQNDQNGLKIKVYHQTRAEDGTRNAAIMILSDMNVEYGRKTIATFNSTDYLLHNSGASYVAHVDLRFSGSNRGSENIAGTELGQLKDIKLVVDFSYSNPVDSGEELNGQVTLVGRDGQDSSFDVTCTRYLKGE